MSTLDVIAHGQANRATVPEIAGHLLGLFGPDLTALMLGAAAPGIVERYALGEEHPPAEISERMRVTYEIAALLEHVESPAIVRAWFMGMNPQLNDQAPAQALRDDPRQVLEAARQFLAEG